MGTDITEESRTQFHSTNSPSQPFQISIMTSFVGHNKGLIDFDQKSLAVAAASIAFNPIFWNTVARQEYHNKILQARRRKLSHGMLRTRRDHLLPRYPPRLAIRTS